MQKSPENCTFSVFSNKNKGEEENNLNEIEMTFGIIGGASCSSGFNTLTNAAATAAVLAE